MEYLECKIFTSTEGIEPVAAILVSEGVESFVTEDKSDVIELLEKKHSYDWDYVDDSVIAMKDSETVITVYLEKTDENAVLIRRIEEGVAGLRAGDPDGLFGRLYVESTVSSDDEWKDNWKEYFKPARITERLVVKPTWEEYEAEAGDLIIEIDPGMAFGTGTHETTSLCMMLMERAILSDEKKSVLDVGSGSGILSIGAALLGASPVKGIEIDPEAVEVGKENVEKNGLSDRVEIVEGDLTKGLDEKYDIIVANLMADLVILLSESARDHMLPGGVFISSGILVERQDNVVEALKEKGFVIDEILEKGEWCAIAASCPR